MESENQRVKFLDVGHGDSSIIYLNSGHSENENVVIVDIVDSDKLLTELTSHKIKVVGLGMCLGVMMGVSIGPAIDVLRKNMKSEEQEDNDEKE